jgi:hypothetical protein
MDGCHIRKLKDPSIDDDAATKKYVDNAVEGVKDRLQL